MPHVHVNHWAVCTLLPRRHLHICTYILLLEHWFLDFIDFGRNDFFSDKGTSWSFWDIYHGLLNFHWFNFLWVLNKITIDDNSWQINSRSIVAAEIRIGTFPTSFTICNYTLYCIESMGSSRFFSSWLSNSLGKSFLACGAEHLPIFRGLDTHAMK